MPATACSVVPTTALPLTVNAFTVALPEPLNVVPCMAPLLINALTVAVPPTVNVVLTVAALFTFTAFNVAVPVVVSVVAPVIAPVPAAKDDCTLLLSYHHIETH